MLEIGIEKYAPSVKQLNFIPLTYIFASSCFCISRILEGDYIEAFMEFCSGIMPLIMPKRGELASKYIDFTLLFVDILKII